MKQEQKKLVGQKFGLLTVIELLPKSNKFNRRLYRCKCECGNETIVPSSCLINGHSSSCGCINSSSNLRIKNYLNKLGINNKPEFTVMIDNRRYRFDFYLPDFNLFIEYDGEQHYYPVSFGERDYEKVVDKFNKIQKYDVIKNKYCDDNDINLLRIPYWKNKEIETIISNHLQRLNDKGSIRVA